MEDCVSIKSSRLVGTVINMKPGTYEVYQPPGRLQNRDKCVYNVCTKYGLHAGKQ